MSTTIFPAISPENHCEVLIAPSQLPADKDARIREVQKAIREGYNKARQENFPDLVKTGEGVLVGVHYHYEGPETDGDGNNLIYFWLDSCAMPHIYIYLLDASTWDWLVRLHAGEEVPPTSLKIPFRRPFVDGMMFVPRP
jgi:hypothetical protein